MEKAGNSEQEAYRSTVRLFHFGTSITEGLLYLYLGVCLSDQLYRLSIFFFLVCMLQVGICFSWPFPFGLPCCCPPFSFLPLNSPDFSHFWNLNPARVPAAQIELSNPFLQVHRCYGNIINHPCEVPAC